MVVMMSCLVFLNVLQVSFSQANHGFQDGSSTIAAPWRNQEPRQINRVLRQFDRWKPGIPRRPSGRPSDWMFIQFLGHTLYTNVQAYRCIQVYMVYIYIWYIYIIYIFKGKKTSMYMCDHVTSVLMIRSVWLTYPKLAEIWSNPNQSYPWCGASKGLCICFVVTGIPRAFQKQARNAGRRLVEFPGFNCPAPIGRLTYQVGHGFGIRKHVLNNWLIIFSIKSNI